MRILVDDRVYGQLEAVAQLLIELRVQGLLKTFRLTTKRDGFVVKLLPL